MANDRANDRANRRTKGKHKPPSRLRYEETHPTVSLRVSRELRNHLDEMRRMSGKSYADILRDGAMRNELSVKESYQRGYEKGWDDAKNEEELCWHCGTYTEDIGMICHECIKLLSPDGLGSMIEEEIEPYLV